jgi:beta-N-acetylhexosaminidase
MMTSRRLAAAGLLAAGAALLTAGPVAATPAVYYANCDQARAAGAAPIQRGEPGYRLGLDRDHDGIACEDTTGAPAGGTSNPSTAPTGGTAPVGDRQESATLPNTGTTVPVAPLLAAAGVLVLGGAGLVRVGIAVRAGRHRA